MFPVFKAAKILYQNAETVVLFCDLETWNGSFRSDFGEMVVRLRRFDGAKMAVRDINHSFSGLICGVFKYKQPVFRQRYKVLRTPSTTFLIRLPTFPILISCFLTLFNRSETIFPDFPTTFRHFPTQFPHFQTRIPPLPHTVTQFSWCDYLCFRYEFPVLRTRIQGFTHSIHHFQTKFHHFSHTIPQLHDAIPSFSNQNFGKSTHKSTVPQLGYAAFKPRLLDFTCFFRRLQGLFAAVLRKIAMKARWNCGCLATYTSGFYVLFRWLQGLFAVKMWCKNGKIWCGNGKIVVYLRRVHSWFPVFLLPRWRNGGAFRAFPILISRISQSIPPFSPPFYSKSASYINISHLPKPPYRNSNRRKQC